MGKRVLIVDDDEMMLKALAVGFKQDKEFLDATFVLSGDQALKVLDHEDIDVVVTDIDMPGLSGIRLMNKIRARHPRTKIIIMSGTGGDELRSTAQQCGCNLFIEKPFLINALRQIVLR